MGGHGGGGFDNRTGEPVGDLLIRGGQDLHGTTIDHTLIPRLRMKSCARGAGMFCPWVSDPGCDQAKKSDRFAHASRS